MTRVPETSSAVQARIEGLFEAQVLVVNRLRKFRVPSDLLTQATQNQSGSDVYRVAENAIVAFVAKDRCVDEEVAVLLLNGKKSCTF